MRIVKSVDIFFYIWIERREGLTGGVSLQNGGIEIRKFERVKYYTFHSDYFCGYCT